MITRIVRMTFRPEEVTTFLQNFEANKAHIRAFDGCEYLELWKERDRDDVYMTHSHWRSDEDLNRYRHSELFKAVWAKTKPLFADKPQAWSVDSLHKLP